MRRILHSAIFLALLLCATPAAADVTVAGSGEPAFTNTTSNTQWINWQGSPSYGTYTLEYDHYDNGVFKTMVSQPVQANGSGSGWTNWAGIVDPLLEGHTYGICVYGRYTIDGIGARDSGSCFHGSQTGKRTSTTIDRTKPTIAVKIDNGAAYSRTADLAYRIDYSDNLAFPFPANFICREAGVDPSQACVSSPVAYNEACSVPDEAKKVTFFECGESLPNVADGPVTLCVQSADAAIPDNPNGSDQSGSAAQANISTRVCDSIVVDRTAPSLAIGAPSSALVGEPVNFGVEASDAGSGLSGSYAWSWGDGTSDGSGAIPVHTFTTPGTYGVQVATTDAAGNEASAVRTITVTAPATSGGSSTGTTTGGSTTAGGSTETPAPGGSAPPAPTGNPIPTVSRLGVVAPRKLRRAPRPRTIAVALTADRPGRASLALVRRGKVHAQGAVTIAAAGTKAYKLKLPKKLAAGAYTLKVSWIASGAQAATSSVRKITLAAARVAKRTRRAHASVRSSLVDPVGAPFGLPDGR